MGETLLYPSFTRSTIQIVDLIMHVDRIVDRQIYFQLKSLFYVLLTRKKIEKTCNQD
jgi:hypothetical protein